MNLKNVLLALICFCLSLEAIVRWRTADVRQRTVSPNDQK